MVPWSPRVLQNSEIQWTSCLKPQQGLKMVGWRTRRVVPLQMRGGLLWQVDYIEDRRCCKCWSPSWLRWEHNLKYWSTSRCLRSSQLEGHLQNRSCPSVSCMFHQRWDCGNSRNLWLLSCQSRHRLQGCPPGLSGPLVSKFNTQTPNYMTSWATLRKSLVTLLQNLWSWFYTLSIAHCSLESAVPALVDSALPSINNRCHRIGIVMLLTQRCSFKKFEALGADSRAIPAKLSPVK